MSVYSYDDFDPNMDLSDVWQGWQFGPYLINEDGTPRTEFPTYQIKTNNPRTVLGYYEPGHYCFVVVDGRRSGYSQGLTLKNLAQLMVDLGCVQAYNMDGGASSQFFWNGKLFNRPSGDGLRPITDIVYLVEPVFDAELPLPEEPEETPLPEETEETPQPEEPEEPKNTPLPEDELGPDEMEQMPLITDGEDIDLDPPEGTAEADGDEPLPEAPKDTPAP